LFQYEYTVFPWGRVKGIQKIGGEYNGCKHLLSSQLIRRNSMSQLIQTWQDLIRADRSTFFKGKAKDVLFDRSAQSIFSPSSEALLTQSNARVLLGHAVNGTLRLVALPTQVFPAPTGASEFGLGPGMYHHFDVSMYAGDLRYQIKIGDEKTIDVGADDVQSESYYAAHIIPMTHFRAGMLEITTISFAPVAPDSSSAPLSPAPLPGPAGVFYLLLLKNTGDTTCRGKVALLADDLLLGHYEDAAPELRNIAMPAIDIRQNILILSRPDGAVGIHFHQGNPAERGNPWVDLAKPFRAERSFNLQPGDELLIETHIAMGARYQDVMPVIYGLHMRTAQEWMNLTINYWLSRLGRLEVTVEGSDAGEFSRDIYIRSIFDNFNCLQTDSSGNLIAHWQGAPSHGYGTVWGIDVEPTAVSVVNLCPEITRQALIFFMNRSRAPKGTYRNGDASDHSIPILVAPLIIARQWLQVTGDKAFLRGHPEILNALLDIMSDLLKVKSPAASLFPSRYSSDGAVGRRYDYGANVKVLYAFDSMAYILKQMDRHEEAGIYQHIAEETRQLINKHMMAEGPFGIQVSGGTNLGEDPAGFYLPEGVFYYDGEDTSSMLAPLYGACDQSDPTWVNYHRYARSMWCPNYDKEFSVLMWSPNEPGIFDGTAFFSRLGGSVTRQEMAESLTILRQNGVDEVTGSVFWWPHGLEHKRALTRCSQGQGAWAWQYIEQWLGLKIDTASQVLILAPRGLPSKVHWEGFKPGCHHFDIFWEETPGGSTAMITNKNDTPWTVEVGFRPYGSGADSALVWQTRALAPGEEAQLNQSCDELPVDQGINQAEMISREVQAFGGGDPHSARYLFRRYGPAQLWGHWDHTKLWDPQAMPLSLRFAILNDSGEDWFNVQVHLTCPDGWTAQGRRPLHWDAADSLMPGTVKLALDDLATSCGTVAPFWVSAPDSARISIIWWNESIGPFHQVSQPGEGIRLYTQDDGIAIKVRFRAELRAQTRRGKTIQKVIEVPVQIAPKSRV
jgi:hypothetical protein